MAKKSCCHTVDHHSGLCAMNIWLAFLHTCPTNRLHVDCSYSKCVTCGRFNSKWMVCSFPPARLLVTGLNVTVPLFFPNWNFVRRYSWARSRRRPRCWWWWRSFDISSYFYIVSSLQALCSNRNTVNIWTSGTRRWRRNWFRCPSCRSFQPRRCSDIWYGCLSHIDPLICWSSKFSFV